MLSRDHVRIGWPVTGAVLLIALVAGWTTGWLVWRTPSVERQAVQQARTQDDLAGWQTFLQAHPHGAGADEARSAIARLSVPPLLEQDAPAPAPAPAEDQALLRRLAGRIEQLQGSIADLEKPVAKPVPPPSPATRPGPQPLVPAIPAAPLAQPVEVSDPRIYEPRTPLAGVGVGIAIVPGADGRLLRWTAEGAIDASVDRGVTWKTQRPASPGLQLDRHGQAGPRPGGVFIATQPAMASMALVSGDGGRSWREQPWPWPAGTATAIQPAIIAGDGRVLVLARSGGTVQCWASADACRSWKATTVFPGAIGIAPTAAGFVMLAAEDGKLGSANTVDAMLTVFANQPNDLPRGPLLWDAVGTRVYLGDRQGQDVIYGFSRSGSLAATDYPGGGDLLDLQRRRLLRIFADGMDGKQWFSVHPQRGLVRRDGSAVGWNACRYPRRVQTVASGMLAGEPVLAATGEQTVVLSLAKPVFDLFLDHLGSP